MEPDVWLALVALFGIGGLTPGPAIMLVLASSFRYGFKPAMLPAYGIASANVIWLILAVSGAAALAMQYPRVFFALKIVGVLVILYLALTTMFGDLPDLNPGEHQSVPRRRLYSKGLALQLSSPLPLVYFGLLLPAYFDAEKPVWPQFWIMLATVTATELAGLAVYAKGAAYIRARLSDPRTARLFNLCIGVVMIASGFWALWSTSG